MISSRKTAQIEADLQAMRAFAASDGRRVLLEQMAAWKQVATTQLADPKVQLDNSIQFLRGILHAVMTVEGMLDGADMIARLETELTLAKASTKEK